MSLQRFNLVDLPAMPWKNGGGVTREIVCQPPGADMDSFDWRVSIAHIASDGPFSSFVGIDRVITLLNGGGVHLLGDDGKVNHCLDTPWAPFSFAGETAIQARLLAGDCHDFNVMTRRAACSASLQVLRIACDWAVTPEGLLMAVQGSWKLEGPSALTLSPQQGVWWSDADTAWRMCPQNPDAVLLALKISR